MTFRILIVDDEDSIRKLLRHRFERRGHAVETAASGSEALLKAASHAPEVVITDLRMPGLDGFGLLAALPNIPTLIITGHGDKESAIRAVEAGAFGFFEKPFDMDSLEISVSRAVEKFRWSREREDLLAELKRLCALQGREIESLGRDRAQAGMLGDSEGLRAAREVVLRLSRKPQATLLVRGESGTGKEIVARELHRMTFQEKAAATPFLALNCASIPTELLESELFGHEKGSFSGAHAHRIGLAEAVRDGTLFLDEIGDMEARHQAKVLRLLQERRFRRVGSNTELEFRGRIVSATHRPLEAMMKAGTFREDLFFRLSMITAELPPLRERGEDVYALAESLCTKHGFKGLAPVRIAELRAYAWPGNIRELNNWIERASILGLHDGQGLVTAPLPQSEPSALPAQDLKSLRATNLRLLDKRLIHDALERSGWNISEVSRELKMDRKNLSRRIKQLGLKKAA